MNLIPGENRWQLANQQKYEILNLIGLARKKKDSAKKLQNK